MTYANFSSPIWDAVRIPSRQPLVSLAMQMCQSAGFDPDLVRSPFAGKKSTPAGLIELRCRIVLALTNKGFTYSDIREQWFTQYAVSTIRDYLVDARKMEGTDA